MTLKLNSNRYKGEKMENMIKINEELGVKRSVNPRGVTSMG